MPRTALTVTSLTGAYAYTGVVATQTAADVANGNKFPLAGTEIIIVENTDVGTHHVTITSAPDALGRTKDITSEVVAAGAAKVFGPFQTNGWKQTDGNLYLSADDVTVKFTVLRPQ